MNRYSKQTTLVYNCSSVINVARSNHSARVKTYISIFKAQKKRNGFTRKTTSCIQRITVDSIRTCFFIRFYNKDNCVCSDLKIKSPQYLSSQRPQKKITNSNSKQQRIILRMKTNISKTTSIWIFLMKSRFKNNVFYKFLSVFPNMDERSFYFGKRQSIRVIKISPRLIFFFKVTKPIHRKLVRTKSILSYFSLKSPTPYLY